MNLTDFQYQLPDELIARYPAEERTASRLLAMDRHDGDLGHHGFVDLVDLLKPNDLLIFNNTRVIPARLFGEKETGGKVEVMVERITSGSRGVAQIRASKSPKPGSRILLDKDLSIRVVDRVDDMFLIESDDEASLAMVLQAVGHMPLPPYIDREDEQMDRERYQTVYSEREGAVAAPTAGLHFDQTILNTLRDKGVNFAFVTLHVGAGTFQPVRAEQIEDHKMHSEYAEVGADVCNQIREARAAGGRIIAVGTTSVRCIETASVAKGWIEPYYGDTEIFIYPGYEYKSVDAMITNFHLPESSLIMLVSAFAGRENTLNAYQTAIEEKYRFFSYGDAMFIS
ncbi:MAG: tRNA preQ1(34) S-adenosylmethionine ribosyltransferase-isomerase QueA [Cellvibrionales bacterium]|nr:tRNA preQ1(34) S-adenosylmethionine ribosyltransferase-isomerase QueA [Cellvibrionales bacterium]